MSACAQTPPGLDDAGAQAFLSYQRSADSRAFAVGGGGAWGWVMGTPSTAQASDLALQRCQSMGLGRCLIYSLNGKTTMQASEWASLWAPYKDQAYARKAPTGTAVGQRFPDLVYKTSNGQTTSVWKQNGHALVLHFWGSWCPPCRTELPNFAALQQTLSNDHRVVFVALQMRESADVSRRWAQREHIAMPLADSTSTSDGKLKLGNGQTIADREIAPSFPSTYVLDRHGLVVFSHEGPVRDWPSYAPLLRDVATHSGR